jgi:hypothetical protein
MAALVRADDSERMPSTAAILAGLTTIANEWWTVAVFWHAYVAGLLLAIAVRRVLSVRLLGFLLVLPLLSVSALAWTSHNPFNGAVFAALSLVLATIAQGLSRDAIAIASWPSLLAGGALVTFGWTYPHFLETTHQALYLIAAPLGLLPCPTLSAIIGVTLIASGLRSAAWITALAGTGVCYGLIGVLRLAVAIDLVLLTAAAALVVTAVVLRRGAAQAIHT